MNSLDPRLRDFILFCVERRGNRWPALYDEMALVAGQRLYKGLGYSELKQMGFSLSLASVDETIKMIKLATASQIPPDLPPP
ncbi:MAG: hypothetical protein AB1597_01640 [Chloroflexota bacterium]